jgi:uncharacterized protein YjiS (DUF1127 family)
MYANATTQTTSRFSFVALPPALAPAERAVALLATWRQRFADRKQLCGLDDHMLRDIGVSRGDVEFEISKPFWRA